MAYFLTNKSNYDYTIKIKDKMVKVMANKEHVITKEDIQELNKKIKNFKNLFISFKKDVEKTDKKETTKTDKKETNKETVVKEDVTDEQK